MACPAVQCHRSGKHSNRQPCIQADPSAALLSTGGAPGSLCEACSSHSQACCRPPGTVWPAVQHWHPRFRLLLQPPGQPVAPEARTAAPCGPMTAAAAAECECASVHLCRLPAPSAVSTPTFIDHLIVAMPVHWCLASQKPTFVVYAVQNPILASETCCLPAHVPRICVSSGILTRARAPAARACAVESLGFAGSNGYARAESFDASGS